MPTSVSVLIPAYNGGPYLPETLDSILSQTCPPAEVIVLDDGSTDNTREVVSGLAPRVAYHHQPNGGICRARNAAASFATSPLLAFCDQDDLWRPDKLAQQMELHARNPTLRYSFTNFSLVTEGTWAERTKLDDAPADFFTAALPKGTEPLVYQPSLYDSLLRFQPIWPSTIVLSRQLFTELQGFREEFGKNPSEDLEFTLRCVQEGNIGIVREPVVGVRRHTANYSGNVDRNTLGQLEILDYALRHHTLSDATRALIYDQMNLRRVEASYGAFHRGDFAQVKSLLTEVPARYLDAKTRLKLLIARLPAPLATPMQKLLVGG